MVSVTRRVVACYVDRLLVLVALVVHVLIRGVAVVPLELIIYRVAATAAAAPTSGCSAATATTATSTAVRAGLLIAFTAVAR